VFNCSSIYVGGIFSVVGIVKLQISMCLEEFILVGTGLIMFYDDGSFYAFVYVGNSALIAVRP